MKITSVPAEINKGQQVNQRLQIRPVKDWKYLLCVLSLFACNKAAKEYDEAGDKNNINNNGVSIHYADSHAGDTVLFFVHGWGIDQTYWSNQVDFFSKRYRVVTIDLPGFGKSGRNRRSWTVKDYAKDITAVIAALDLKNVILIGHSMSGSIVLESALMNPSRTIGLVGIDNFRDAGIVLTSELERQWDSGYQALRKNFKASASSLMEPYLFSPSTDDAVRSRVLHDILNADTTLAVDALESADKYPIREKLKLYSGPLYLINSNYIPTDTVAFQKNSIPYFLLTIDSTGHYPMVERADAFNTLLHEVVNRVSQDRERK